MPSAASDLRLRAAWLAAGSTVALAGVWLLMAGRPSSPSRPLALHPVEAPAATGAAPTLAAVVAPSPVPEPAPQVDLASPLVVATRTASPAPARTPPMPYRFVGRTVTKEGTSVVLFGRGRVFTVTGPQALDDDHAVEAMFDDYLVLRHRPTGAGQFLATGPRPHPGVRAVDPEDSPRD